jgi:tetratricopeptide (TPR) repeat protein
MVGTEFLRQFPPQADQPTADKSVRPDKLINRLGRQFPDTAIQRIGSGSRPDFLKKETKMPAKTIFLFIGLIFCFTYLYAGDLILGESIDRYNEGVKFQKEGNFQAAQMAYQKALLIDPKNTTLEKFIINNTGVMYLVVGELNKAESAFLEALKVDPGYKTAQLNLGIVYELQGDECKSLKYWAGMFNLDEMKPKAFTLEEEKEEIK